MRKTPSARLPEQSPVVGAAPVPLVGAPPVPLVGAPPVPLVGAAPVPTVEPSRWRTDPARLSTLVAGLIVFGIGEGLIVRAALGNSPWTVFAEGVSLWTPMSIGVATIVTGVVILLMWIPLRTKLGLGTLLNVVLIGLALDATLLVVPEVNGLLVRAAIMLGGIAVVGIGSGLYLGTQHGPGPRDGLMTGLHRRTGRPVGLIRGGIEVSALAIGWALGGTVGAGTLVFAALIGPSVQAGIALDTRARRRISGRSG